MSNAAIACGADGLLIEVHSRPPDAWSDGDQSLDPEELHTLVKGLRAFAAAAGREV
jgi:3-deoxy-7-phosphoheptulonate synthase